MFGTNNKELVTIRQEVSRLTETVGYLVKVLQHTNVILDPTDKHNPIKKLKKTNQKVQEISYKIGGTG